MIKLSKHRPNATHLKEELLESFAFNEGIFSKKESCFLGKVNENGFRLHHTKRLAFWII